MRKPPVANVVIPGTQHAGEFLLLHHNTPHTKWWELPGGKKKDDEDMVTAAVRECMEELGVEVDIRGSLGRVAVPNAAGIDIDCTWFQGQIVSGEPVARERRKHDIAMYIDLGAYGVGSLDLSPSAMKFTRLFQNGDIQLYDI